MLSRTERHTSREFQEIELETEGYEESRRKLEDRHVQIKNQQSKHEKEPEGTYGLAGLNGTYNFWKAAM
jgi:hypothetical protein